MPTTAARRRFSVVGTNLENQLFCNTTLHYKISKIGLVHEQRLFQNPDCTSDPSFKGFSSQMRFSKDVNEVSSPFDIFEEMSIVAPPPDPSPRGNLAPSPTRAEIALFPSPLPRMDARSLSPKKHTYLLDSGIIEFDPRTHLLGRNITFTCGGDYV